jgi:DNA repair exonuclease SbcCD ATPase subunit
MNPDFKDNERELIRLITFFKKRADKLITEGALEVEHEKLISACEKLVDTLTIHAENRSKVMEQRELIKNLVKDNAVCPKCGKNTHLKTHGTEKHENGWTCNVYRCRRCNIEFVWTAPNNAWDMIAYLEQSISQMEAKMLDEVSDESREQSQEMMTQMKGNVEKLKLVIESSDAEYEDMKQRDTEISKMVHEFKNHLLIEKIRMDTWTGPN